MNLKKKIRCFQDDKATVLPFCLAPNYPLSQASKNIVYEFLSQKRNKHFYLNEVEFENAKMLNLSK